MRLRTDLWWDAAAKRSVRLGGRPDPRQDDSKNWAPDYLVMLDDPAVEPAQEGDVWVVRTDPDDEQTFATNEAHPDWAIIGYGLTCPRPDCREGVHLWTHATNCEDGGSPCMHRRERRSCWTWTGSVEDGTLTASPSLHSPADRGGCGFHGHLRDGVLAE